MERVGPAQLAALRSATIVDLRDDEEREAVGWIPGSLWHPATDDRARWAGSLPRGGPLVLVCMTGRRSSELVEEVGRRIGCEVRDLEGGVIGWAAAGLPVARAERSALPDAVAGDLRELSIDEFRRDVLSCFVATAIKVDATGALQDDPRTRVYDVFDGTLDGLAQARMGVDRLAARAFAAGYPLDVIAENCSFYYQLARHITAS